MKKSFTYSLAAIWIVLVSFFISNLHGLHMASFDVDNKSVSQSIAYFSKENSKATNIIHFLTPSCSCSKVIKEDLLQRKPLNSQTIQEKVVLIDDIDRHFSKELNSRGYEVLNIDYKTLSREIPDAINAVPMLAIHDKDRRLQYAGGYSESTITPLTKIDLKKLISISRSKDKRKYKVKGCAVSKKYQALLDPLGVKYVKAN